MNMGTIISSIVYISMTVNHIEDGESPCVAHMALPLECRVSLSSIIKSIICLTEKKSRNSIYLYVFDRRVKILF